VATAAALRRLRIHIVVVDEDHGVLRKPGGQPAIAGQNRALLRRRDMNVSASV
jgi:hypothetical protein